MIALGCDHAGYPLMQTVREYLDESGIPYTDFGADSTRPVDYPVYAHSVAEAVLAGRCDRGILICGTGIGVSIAANRFHGVRCALCHDVFSAKAAREHNDANILAMGGRVIGTGPALEVLRAFLETSFSGGENHIRRIGMLDQ